MNGMIRFILARGQEGESYAGLAVLLSMFAVPNATGITHEVTLIGTGICGLLAIVIKQYGAKWLR